MRKGSFSEIETERGQECAVEILIRGGRRRKKKRKDLHIINQIYLVWVAVMVCVYLIVYCHHCTPKML